MITNIIVTDREQAQGFVDKHSPNCVWVTISQIKKKPLINKSSKKICVAKFNDITVDPITKNQADKIKKFISNHHKNNEKQLTLVINCRAGKSRSAAVAMWCKHCLGIDQIVFTHPSIDPNRAVMEMFGVSFKHL